MISIINNYNYVIFQDKELTLQALLKILDDALFKVGNDAAVNELIDTWPSRSECPVESIQTGSWLETIEIFRERGFVD